MCVELFNIDTIELLLQINTVTIEHT